MGRQMSEIRFIVQIPPPTRPKSANDSLGHDHFHECTWSFDQDGDYLYRVVRQYENKYGKNPAALIVSKQLLNIKGKEHIVAPIKLDWTICPIWIVPENYYPEPIPVPK